MFRRRRIQKFAYNVWEGFLAMSFNGRDSFQAVHLAQCHQTVHAYVLVTISRINSILEGKPSQQSRTSHLEEPSKPVV
jgi:hypothetical protein